MRPVEWMESLRMALSSLAAHKLRSALTLLGVLVGVFSIVVVMTALRIMQTNMESEISRLGSDTFQIQRWPALGVRGPQHWEKYARRKYLSYDLVQRVESQASLARAVGVDAHLWVGQARSRFEATNPDIRLRGVSPGTFGAKGFSVEDGRILVNDDIEQARRVCVLGNDVAKKIFPFGSAVGEEIQFHSLRLRVVGVLQSRGGMFGETPDNFIAIPVTTGLNAYGKERDLSLLVQARSQAVFEEAIEQVRGILRTLRKVPPGQPEDFDIFSNDTLIGQFRSVTLAVRIGVAVVSSIALLAAGIGIMNIMLVAVTERTREIGIRRAIGAKKRNILWQFVLEAIVLCQVGGVAGVFFGVLGGNLAAYFLKVSPVIPLDWIGFSLLICSVVGLVFGTYPAFKAAHLDPIESLRYE